MQFSPFFDSILKKIIDYYELKYGWDLPFCKLLRGCSPAGWSEHPIKALIMVFFGLLGLETPRDNIVISLESCAPSIFQGFYRSLDEAYGTSQVPSSGLQDPPMEPLLWKGIIWIKKSIAATYLGLPRALSRLHGAEQSMFLFDYFFINNPKTPRLW